MVKQDFSKEQLRDVFAIGVAPAGTHFLVMAHNTDGRVCAWAKGPDLARVRERVTEIWQTHGGDGCGCYDNEQRGEDEILLVTAEPITESKVICRKAGL